MKLSQNFFIKTPFIILLSNEEFHLCFKREWSRLTFVTLAFKCKHWTPKKYTSRPAGWVDPVIRLVWVLLCFQ